MTTVYVQCLMNMKYGGWVRYCHKQGNRRMSHDISWLGFPGLWVFSFHDCATMDVFYTTTIFYILRYSDITYGGYKHIHH
jgi:hypothetical protein